MLRFAMAGIVATLPASAVADYLYGMGTGAGPTPYVLFVADVSGSMSKTDAGAPPDCCVCETSKCNECNKKPRCDQQLSRMDALKNTLQNLLPRIDNVSLGLMKFGVKSTVSGKDNYCGIRLDNPLPVTSNGKVPTLKQLSDSISNFKPDGGTPIGQALVEARTHLLAVRAADDSAGCRPYAVVVLTDGEPDCGVIHGGHADEKDGDRARNAVNELRKSGIPTYVIGFGGEAKRDILNNLARRGGTARVGNSWCTRSGTGRCSEGEALFAGNASELTNVFQAALQDIKRGTYSVMPPIIGTVPQVASEYDRVSRNFLTYSAFEIPDYKGHLYGIRLFEEKEGSIGTWEFTDLSEKNEKFSLSNCGSEGNPCVFDAGKRLQERPSTRPRTIFFSTPVSTESENGSLVLTMGEKVEFGVTLSEWTGTLSQVMRHLVSDDSPLAPGVGALNEDPNYKLRALASPIDAEEEGWQRTVAKWIDGSGRPWRLGDVYHSAPAIVTGPPYSYRFLGYPAYKASWKMRPAMLYVGANDGQIHAFHASDDHFPPDGKEPRWKAGDEAWAYVPYNMVAKVSLAAIAGERRVFSQDLSCRVDDVLAVNTQTADGVDCSKDPLHEERGTCGWRTIIICGQGWGGSWYTAIDVTDPFDPIPLWEATHHKVKNGGTTEEYGLGRTWAVPSVGVVNYAISERETVPKWISVFGSGYNTDLKDDNGATSATYRYLNMPFRGSYPEHGDGTQGEKSHVFVQDMVTGSFLRTFHFHGHGGGVNDQDAILADIPLVSLSRKIFTDVAYVGGWSHGRMDRLAFVGAQERTKPSDWSYCGGIFHFANSRPLTSRPSAFVDPDDPNKVYVFVGSGLDKGSDPDQQGNSGGQWEFRGFHFSDAGTAACPAVSNNSGNICTNGTKDTNLKNIFETGARLLAPPTLAIQRDRSRWLTFTTWLPTANSCGEGTSHIYCLDVTGTDVCTPCGSLDEEDEDGESRTEIGSKKPQTPGAADGQLYVIGDKGIERVGNQSGQGGGPGGFGIPNSNAPRAVILSWREIF